MEPVTTGHHRLIDRLEGVQCKPCATGDISPSLPPSLLPLKALGPSILQICTTSPHMAQGQGMSFTDPEQEHQ